MLAGAVRLWSAETGKPAGVLTEHHGAVLALSWSPDGLHLASGGHDCRVRVWKLTAVADEDDATSDDAPSLDVKRLVGHGGCARALAWSCCGTLLASASDDKTVRATASPACR